MAQITEFQTPGISQGWAGQYPKGYIMSGFIYDLTGQILYATYPQQQYDVYLQVQTSLAQQLVLAGKQNSSQQGFPNPDVIYTQQIEGVFPQCILTENGSPLLTGDGRYLVLT